MSIHMIVDSCCDTTPELAAYLHADVAPLKVKIGEKLFNDDGTSDPMALLKAMAETKQAASSACPSPEEFAEHMRHYDQCIVITLSDKLSGSYNAACVAADIVREKSPEKQIHVFNSKSASAGELLLAVKLKEHIDAGMGFDALVEAGEQEIKAMHTLFVLEDLGNFVKNGRLSKVSGIVASILSLCPIMGDDGNGEVKMMAKARGNQNALNKLVELVAKMTEDKPTDSLRMAMCYCNCRERAEKLKSDLLEKCSAIRDILMAPTACLSTMYANNGGIVLAF